MAWAFESHNYCGVISIFNICLAFCQTCTKPFRMSNWVKRLTKLAMTIKWLSPKDMTGLYPVLINFPISSRPLLSWLAKGDRKENVVEHSFQSLCHFLRKDCLQIEMTGKDKFIKTFFSFISKGLWVWPGLR